MPSDLEGFHNGRACGFPVILAPTLLRPYRTRRSRPAGGSGDDDVNFSTFVIGRGGGRPSQPVAFVLVT